MKTRKIKIVTLGCPKNVVDSEKLLKQISEGGYDISFNNNDQTADTVIINTCGFINDAKEESIDTILRYVRAKETGQINKLFVTGCLSERYKNELKSEIPEVNDFFGVSETNRLLENLNIHYNVDISAKRVLTSPGHYAYLKISEGCDRSCSFCAIPSIRGKYISRPVEELLEEASILAESGVRELILVAQDLSYYGLDLYKTRKLPFLVNELLKIEPFVWIRMHYLYPANFSPDLIPVIKNNPRICKYLDIPIQHISDKMLELMRRSHNRKETENLLYTLRNEIPDAVIRTTLIAGHPGETEAEFEELKEFVKEFKFNRLGIFKYSHEENTYSYNNFTDTVSDEIKEKRVSEIMELQQEISAGLNEKLKGKVLNVVIERREAEYYIGRTEYDSPEIDQEVMINTDKDLKPGNFYKVLITQTSDFDLFGTII